MLRLFDLVFSASPVVHWPFLPEAPSVKRQIADLISYPVKYTFQGSLESGDFVRRKRLDRGDADEVGASKTAQ